MKRGDIIRVAFTGDFGKPRPAVVIQSDLLTGTETVLVCLITSDIVQPGLRRLQIEPSPENGLRKSSQIMVEKIFAAKREKCREPFGRLDPATMARLSGALAYVTGLLEES